MEALPSLWAPAMQIYFKSTQAMMEQLVRKFRACSLLWVHGHQTWAGHVAMQCPRGASEGTAAQAGIPFLASGEQTAMRREKP